MGATIVACLALFVSVQLRLVWVYKHLFGTIHFSFKIARWLLGVYHVLVRGYSDHDCFPACLELFVVCENFVPHTSSWCGDKIKNRMGTALMLSLALNSVGERKICAQCGPTHPLVGYLTACTHWAQFWLICREF